MIKNKRLLLKNSLFLSLSPFLPQVINVLLLPVMTRYLTDVDFGISATISAYSLSISAFSTLGLTVVIQNSFFKHPYHYTIVWRQIYGFLNIWMIVYACFQALLLYFFIPEEAIENRWLIIIATNFSTVFFGPTATIGNAYYIYSKKSLPVVWRSLLTSLITILSNFILIVHFNFGYMGWYISSFIGTFFSNATYWYLLRKELKLTPIYKFKWKSLKRYLSISSPTIPHYYTPYLLDSSGRMVMDQHDLSQNEMGRIGISQQVGGLFQTGMNGIYQAISPYIMQALKDEKPKIIKKFGLIFVVLIFGLAFSLSLWSKEIFNILLSNSSLKTAYPYFIIFVMSSCYRPMYLIASNYYFYFEKTKQLLFITFLSGCLAFITYLVFVPLYGVWAFLIGHYIACLYYGYSGYFYSGYANNSTLNVPVIKIMLIQIILTFSAFFLVEFFVAKAVITLLLLAFIVILIYKNKDVLEK